MLDARRRASKPIRTLKQRAIALLARREYARAELAARLTGAGALREEVEPLLDELQRLGLLCDERYAGAVVRQKSGNYARRAIGRALQERGVSREVAKAALAEVGPGDEFEEAQVLWERRFGYAPGDEREKARQLRFLISRGFPASIAYRVLRQAGTRIDED